MQDDKVDLHKSCTIKTPVLYHRFYTGGPNKLVEKKETNKVSMRGIVHIKAWIKSWKQRRQLKKAFEKYSKSVKYQKIYKTFDEYYYHKSKSVKRRINVVK